MTVTPSGAAASRPAPPPPRDLEAPPRELPRGEVLYRAGDRAASVYRVEEGLLKLSLTLPTGRERIVALAGQSELVGALAPSQDRYQESAEVLSRSATLTAVPRELASLQLERELFAAAAEQLWQAREALLEADLPVPVRVARVLLRLGDRFGQPEEPGTVRLALPLTQEHLASMVGAARETTTGALCTLRARGVLRGTRGRYSFHRAALAHLAAQFGPD